jgi:hypothetical protein
MHLPIRVNFGDQTANAVVTVGHFVFVRSLDQKSLDGGLLVHADDRVIGSGHADIGDVSGAFRENPGVCCGICVWVPATTEALPVNMPCKGHFFCGGFGMKIERKRYWSLRGFFRAPTRRSGKGHQWVACRCGPADLTTPICAVFPECHRFRIQIHAPLSGNSWSQQPGIGFHVGINLPFGKTVISACDHMDAKPYRVRMISSLIPIPSWEFSALAMTKSASYLLIREGRSVSRSERPGDRRYRR